MASGAPLMAYRFLEDAREALDAWADEYLCEWGLLPLCGTGYRLTEDHPLMPRLQGDTLPPAALRAQDPGEAPPTRHMFLPS